MKHTDLPNKGAEQIDLMSHRMQRDDPILSQVMRYWDSLRDGDILPARSDLDPRVIQNALGQAFILDRARPGTVRFRVAGHHLNALMGMEVRGMPIRAFFELMERRKLMEHVEACFTAPALLELDLVAEDDVGKPLHGRMLILPMRDHEGAVTKALGCLATEGLVGTPPRRFKLLREQLTPVNYAPVTARTPAPAHTPRGLAESFSPYTAAPIVRPAVAAPADRLDATDVPYLKVVRH